MIMALLLVFIRLFEYLFLMCLKQMLFVFKYTYFRKIALKHFTVIYLKSQWIEKLSRLRPYIYYWPEYSFLALLTLPLRSDKGVNFVMWKAGFNCS